MFKEEEEQKKQSIPRATFYYKTKLDYKKKRIKMPILIPIANDLMKTFLRKKSQLMR